MGAAHGEKVVRAYRRAVQERLPMVVLSASGGARMQEGMVSLIQMARTAGAARDHAGAGLLSLAIHRGPTTGGVLASYASLVDVSAARPGAVIGFTGPRVVELTTGERVPEGSHTAESAYAHGLVDALVAEEGEAAWIDSVLGIHGAAAGARTPVAAAVEPADGPWGEVMSPTRTVEWPAAQWDQRSRRYGTSAITVCSRPTSAALSRRADWLYRRRSHQWRATYSGRTTIVIGSC